MTPVYTDVYICIIAEFYESLTQNRIMIGISNGGGKSSSYSTKISLKLSKELIDLINWQSIKSLRP